MSDINIILDGVISFLVALALALCLLLCLAIFSLRCFMQARRKGEQASRQPIFAHLIGMSVSLCCCIIIILLVWIGDSQPPHTLNNWLDGWVVIWAAAILALWPLTLFAIKRWRSYPGDSHKL